MDKLTFNTLDVRNHVLRVVPDEVDRHVDFLLELVLVVLRPDGRETAVVVLAADVEVLWASGVRCSAPHKSSY